MPKILVTGGAGYIGSHFVQHLVQTKKWPENDIIVLDNFSQGHREVLPKGVVFFEGDVREKEDVASVFVSHKIDSVVHFAGILNVAESMQKPEDYFITNVIGGLNILTVMKEFGCNKMVFSSSCTVYGAAQSPVTEETPNQPISPYGESKLQFEKILEWFGKIYGIKSVSLRYFNAAGAAYGIGEWHDPEIHIIPSVLKAAKNNDKIIIFGNDYDTPDGTCVRDYVHVVDLADAHVRALEYLENGDVPISIFNLGSGIGASVKEIVEIGERVTGNSIVMKYVGRRPGDAPKMVATAEKAANTLGWKPKYTVENCIEDAWRWLQSR